MIALQQRRSGVDPGIKFGWRGQIFAAIFAVGLFAVFQKRGVVHTGRDDGRGNYHSDKRKGDKQIMHLLYLSTLWQWPCWPLPT
jgi:hypothetical protein